MQDFALHKVLTGYQVGASFLTANNLLRGQQTKGFISDDMGFWVLEMGLSTKQTLSRISGAYIYLSNLTTKRKAQG